MARPDYCFARYLLSLPDVLASASTEDRPAMVMAMDRHTLQRSFAYLVVSGHLPIIYHVLAIKQDILLNMEEDSLTQLLLLSCVGLIAAAFTNDNPPDINLQGWPEFVLGMGGNMPTMSMTTRIQILQAVDAAAPRTLNLSFRRTSPLFAIASSLPSLNWPVADCRDLFQAILNLRNVTFDAREYQTLRMRCEIAGLRHYLPATLLNQKEDVERRTQMLTRRDTPTK